MSFIIKINSYYNNRGIEIQEEERVSGNIPSGRPQYTAIVNIQVKAGEEVYTQPISTKFHAVGIEDAFKKAESKLKIEIDKFQREMEKRVEQMKDESRPSIIKPDGT